MSLHAAAVLRAAAMQPPWPHEVAEVLAAKRREFEAVAATKAGIDKVSNARHFLATKHLPAT